MFQIQFDPTGEDRIKVRVAFLWPQYRTKTPYANADFLNSHMAVYIEIYIEIYCKTSDVISTSFDSFWLDSESQPTVNNLGMIKLALYCSFMYILITELKQCSFYTLNIMFSLFFRGSGLSECGPELWYHRLKLEEYIFGFLFKYLWFISYLLWTRSTSLRIKLQTAFQFFKLSQNCR